MRYKEAKIYHDVSIRGLKYELEEDKNIIDEVRAFFNYAIDNGLIIVAPIDFRFEYILKADFGEYLDENVLVKINNYKKLLSFLTKDPEVIIEEFLIEAIDEGSYVTGGNLIKRAIELYIRDNFYMVCKNHDIEYDPYGNKYDYASWS